MGQQVNVYRKLKIWPGATVEGFGIPGLSKVYYVDNTNGDNGNAGTDPSYAKSTVQGAIDVCTNWNNDYIFVMRKATTDHTTTTPILMNKHTVHLIGLANANPQGSLVRLVHTNDTDNVLEFPLDTGYHCEVAGFGFGGGTTAKGGIGMSDSGASGLGAWIHHCNFGSILTKGTPDYGIHNDDTGAHLFQWTIEDCGFYGSGDNGVGVISVNGINCVLSPGAHGASHLLIRNNIFMDIPGVAINLDGVISGMVLDNTFKVDGNTAGAAITLGNDSLSCWVDGNRANHGSTNDMVALPWVDDSSTDANTWGLNYTGSTAEFPA